MILFKFLMMMAQAFAEPVSASSHQALVLVRGDEFRPVLREVELQDLSSDQRFEGKHFKIVKGVEEVPILLNDPDPELRLKAGTVYHHLTLARRFWVQNLSSEFVKSLPPLVIRLEMTRAFSDLAHYQHERVAPEYNNALSIPQGWPMDGVGGDSWGNEIWFRPKKQILTRDLPGSGLSSSGNPISAYLQALTRPIKESVVSRLIQITLQRWFYPATLATPYRNQVLQQAGTLAMGALILSGSRYLDSLFLEKYYYLDTAMIPEIIYHEFAHIALSDHLKLTLSTPMLEGLADYFATAVSGNPEIASNIRQYSLSMPKNGRNPIRYDPAFETLYFSNSDFVLSTLWRVRDLFPERADLLILKASQRLSTARSDIRHDLIRALLEACREFCLAPRADRLRLRQSFEDKGF
ncbi:MAG: hypothetical protein KGP28_05805 [Bdellovibrionales bacterium]|nr:hypothetical protein [Bdellovibrionales bacterium]